LPVIIHSREAQHETQRGLREWITRVGKPSVPLGVIHCFNGDTTTARAFLEMGFYLSLGAYVGYPTARRTHDTFRFIPPDRLLIETDSPFLPPQNRRGQRNEPAYLLSTLAVLAQIRNERPETLAEQTTKNARTLFYRGY
jgi:TatD DNase family protein